MADSRPRIAVLTGPTASGKTAFALDYARAHPGIEIINADSMLVYRGLDIGTAKPSPAEMQEIAHHLIDIRDPGEPFTAGDFHREANAILEEIERRGKRPLVVGGTGFYLKALLYGLWDAPKADPELRKSLETFSDEALLEKLMEKDPVSAARIGPNDRYRLLRALELIEQSGKTPTELQGERPADPDPRFSLLVVDREPRELEDRIAERSRKMLEGGEASGILSEVRWLRREHPDSRTLLAVGYRQVSDYLDDRPPPGRKIAPGLEGLADEINLATRQLVKSQRTFFRGLKEQENFLLDRDREKLTLALERIYR